MRKMMRVWPVVLVVLALGGGCGTTLRVENKLGRPVRDAEVAVWRYSVSPPDRVYTDKHGEASIPWSAAAIERIVVAKDGYASEERTAALLEDPQPTVVIYPEGDAPH